MSCRGAESHDGWSVARLTTHGGWRRKRWPGWLVLGLATLLTTTTPVEAKPQRIVSINICADALVLELAPRASIASVTFLATDSDYSPKASAAQGIPVNRGKAEEILALQPDLVVAGRYTGQTTVRLLRSLGFNLVELEMPVSIAQAREQIHRLATALEEPARGDAVIAQLDARLDAVKEAGDSRRPLAAIYQPNGFTAGQGSLADEMLGWAGIDNLAARVGIRFWGNLSLEQLILATPDLLIVEPGTKSGPALARQLLSHPALEHLKSRVMTLEIPSRYWSCAGPWLVEPIERLAAARRAWAIQHANTGP